ncbi:centrobin isoform X2 [Tachysurus ichikawai]
MFVTLENLSVSLSVCISASPQAVVLQLCRDQERGIRGQGAFGVDRGRVEFDLSLLNHSHTFSPLEPVLDNTNLTAIGGGGDGDLWDSPVERERQTVYRGTDQGREQTGREKTTQSGDNLTSHSTHSSQDLYCEVNHRRIQSDQRVTRQPFPSPNVNLTQTLNPRPRPNQAHALTDVWANHSSDRRTGRGDVSKQMYNSAGTTAPLTEEKSLSVKTRAPSLGTTTSTLCDERQNELQYYIAKLLERSPGEPLDVHQADLSKNTAETQSTNSGVSSQVEPKPEQLTDSLHLTLPSTHTPQQLQQHLDSFMRLGETFAEPVRDNLNLSIAQNNKRERQSASRATQIMATRGRRAGPQGQRSGSKVNAWR